MVITEEFVCTGCNQVIKDRYIFGVDDQKLHHNCLKCCKCKCVLNVKCWYRQNKFYCKDDYDRLIQQMTSCIVCKKMIEKNTLKHTFYNINVHLNCFRCSECDRALKSGDHFVLMKDNKFLCTSHHNTKICLESKGDHTFDRSTNDQLNMLNSNSSIHLELMNKNSIYSSIDRPASQQFDHHSSQHHLTPNSMNLIDYTDFNENDEEDDETHPDEHFYDSSYNSPIDHSQPVSDHFIDNYWTQVSLAISPLNSNENLNKQIFQRSKGRPKKRKLNNFQIHSVDSMDTALHEQDLNHLNSSNSSSSFNQIRLISSNSSHSSSSSISSSAESTTRVKRNRTSFKPYQLKMMKDYFSINKNPDSKELLQLSLRTQLTKRTLQVFFQNQRAKYRRQNHNKDDGSLVQQNFSIR